MDSTPARKIFSRVSDPISDKFTDLRLEKYLKILQHESGGFDRAFFQVSKKLAEIHCKNKWITYGEAVDHLIDTMNVSVYDSERKPKPPAAKIIKRGP